MGEEGCRRQDTKVCCGCNLRYSPEIKLLFLFYSKSQVVSPVSALASGARKQAPSKQSGFACSSLAKPHGTGACLEEVKDVVLKFMFCSFNRLFDKLLLNTFGGNVNCYFLFRIRIVLALVIFPLLLDKTSFIQRYSSTEENPCSIICIT